jgi:hypothetical protein
MYSWVSTEFRWQEFRWHEISSTWNSIDTKFRRHKISSTWDSSVDTEFLRRHGIPLSTQKSPLTQKSPVDIEFPRRHGIPPSTRHSPVDTEFHQHRIFRIQKYTEFRGIPRFSRILRASLYNMYEFEYFKCKYVRITSKISGLAEVESASFFLVR